MPVKYIIKYFPAPNIPIRMRMKTTISLSLLLLFGATIHGQHKEIVENGKITVEISEYTVPHNAQKPADGIARAVAKEHSAV